MSRPAISSRCTASPATSYATPSVRERSRTAPALGWTPSRGPGRQRGGPGGEARRGPRGAWRARPPASGRARGKRGALLFHVWDGLSYIDVATSLGSASARRPRRLGPEPSCVGARRPCRRSSRGRGSGEPHRNLRRSSATAAGRAASVLFSPLRARICHRPGRRSSRRPPGRSFPPRTSLRPSDRWRWI